MRKLFSGDGISTENYSNIGHDDFSPLEIHHVILILAWQNHIYLSSTNADGSL